MSGINLDHYYHGINPDLFDIVPLKAANILDVGSAVGAMGKMLKNRQKCKISGIEYSPKMAEQAKEHIDQIVVGDVETINLPFEKKSFDCIIYGDVLEHLRDPWKVLKTQKEYLQEDGLVVASIPNIQNVRTIRMLLKGRWEYTEWGIMDSTHLRFFTRREIYKLFQDAGYKGISVKPTPLPKKARWITKILHKFMPDFFTIQFLVKAQN